MKTSKRANRIAVKEAKKNENVAYKKKNKMKGDYSRKPKHKGLDY